MKVAIMQPYFFPYIGYFQLIKHTDLFILFDDSQYIRHGWVNRNRILKPEKDWQYIIAPLQEYKQTTQIKDIRVQNNEVWKDKIIRQIEHYKKKAPFYSQTKVILEECLHCKDDSVTKLNSFAINKICNFLEVPLNLKISSCENFDYSNVNDSGEWALRICEQLKATEYLNPIGGMSLFSPNKFSNSNVKLNFIIPTNITYNQRRNGIIENGLSIIDVMMFNSLEDIYKLLNKCEIQSVN